MNIEILQLLDGAKKADGLTVIIDVFRAFSTACYITEKGAAPIYPTGDIEDAFRLKREISGAILVGERNERPPEGFDFGNSPYLILNADIANRPVIHTTSSGTQGIVNAINANEIITGSFVNAGAIVNYIKLQKPEKVSLVCMGYACQYPTDEDTLCAEYLRNELTGKHSNWSEMYETIRQGSGARFFEHSGQQWAPREDFDMCLHRNRFNFVLKVKEKEGMLYLHKIELTV